MRHTNKTKARNLRELARHLTSTARSIVNDANDLESQTLARAAAAKKSKSKAREAVVPLVQALLESAAPYNARAERYTLRAKRIVTNR